eukprot:2425898-Pyramimonas_sp.AAC.1
MLLCSWCPHFPQKRTCQWCFSHTGLRGMVVPVAVAICVRPPRSLSRAPAGLVPHAGSSSFMISA